MIIPGKLTTKGGLYIALMTKGKNHVLPPLLGAAKHG